VHSSEFQIKGLNSLVRQLSWVITAPGQLLEAFVYLSKTIKIVWIGQDILWGSLYVTECSFDRPRSRVRALLWSLSFGNFGLTTLLHWGKGGEQSFCLAQRSHYFCAMLWKCLAITPFGRLRCEYCLHLLLWALWPLLGINASRYLIECTECQILFA
jgi:hypothetical protein